MRLSRILPVLLLCSGVVVADGAAPPTRAILSFDARSEVPTEHRLSSLGMDLLHRFEAIPAVAVAGDRLALTRAASALGAAAVEFDRPLRYMMDTATSATNAIDVWAETWRPEMPPRRPALEVDGKVIDGRGVTVGVVDSGIDALHPDLYYAPAWVPGMPMEPKVLACVNISFPTSVTVDGTEVGEFDEATASTPYCDQTVGHGTHVAGIVAGNAFAQRQGLAVETSARQPFVGAAPGAQLVGAGLGAGLNIVGAATALDFMYDQAERYGIRIVTNSWGDEPGCFGGGFSVDSISRIVNQLVAKDITVLFAAGNYNNGPQFTTTYSRNLTPGVISVANYTDVNAGTRDGRISGGSSDGCTESASGLNRVWSWPDVAAPGTSITSTAAPTGAAIVPGTAPPFYGTASGTSMATPHVAGIVALMVQANPNITPAQVERILIESATPWSDTVASRGIAGSEIMWGPTNIAAKGFVEPDECFISPADVADPEGSGSDLFLFTDVPERDRFLCRDYRRGAGLVDAYAAVQAALDLRD